MPSAVNALNKHIEPDFAHRHWRMKGEVFTQRHQIRFLRGVDVERMNAEGDFHAGPAAQRAHSFEVVSCHRGHHHAAHTLPPCPLDHRLAVGIEFGGVEMAVGVDQHVSFCTTRGWLATR